MAVMLLNTFKGAPNADLIFQHCAKQSMELAKILLGRHPQGLMARIFALLFFSFPFSSFRFFVHLWLVRSKFVWVGRRQDNGNRSNQESKFDFLATRQCLVKIDEGQTKNKNKKVVTEILTKTEGKNLLFDKSLSQI